MAGLAVFTTDDPTAQLPVVLNAAIAHYRRRTGPSSGPICSTTYCVYESTMPMPDYQPGAAPFNFECASDDPRA